MEESTLYDTSATSASAGLDPITTVVYLVVLALVLAAMWKIFTKAGKPGWAALVPFYNVYVLLQIVGRPGWWLVLFLIPLVNFVVGIIVALDLAKVFGRSGLFGFFLNFLFSPIGQLIIGFGGSTYRGPAGSDAAQAPAQA